MRLANAPWAYGGTHRFWEVSFLSISKCHGQDFPRQPLHCLYVACIYRSAACLWGQFQVWAVSSNVGGDQGAAGAGPGSRVRSLDNSVMLSCCNAVSAASTSLSCNLSSRLHNGNWSANLLILNSNWRSIVREPIIWRRYHFSITHYPHN